MKAHLHQAAPDDDATIKAIADVLAAKTQAAPAATGIETVLAPWHVSKQAVLAALGLAGSGTTHRPNARLKGHTGDRRASGVAKDARDNEINYRAAYVMNAATRIDADLKAGHTLADALVAERPFNRAHEVARRGRLNTASKMQALSRQFGPLLGWYRDPLSNSESECYEADGHNFYASQGTIIGYPGAVHPHCHCVAGPPHSEGGMVNDNVSVKLAPPIARTYKLKK